MNKFIAHALGVVLLSTALLLLVDCGASDADAAGKRPVAIVIHGGAGTLPKDQISSERQAAYRSKLKEALRAGHTILVRGGSSLDAITAAIRIMEDSPLFNAGKGAVFTNAGSNELDASIMDGSNRMAGAVAGVKRVKNPITLARAVMEQSEHVMMSGAGAEKFAEAQNIELVEQRYFYTQRRWDALLRARAKAEEPQAALHGDWENDKFGTVGAVALDQHGNLAAGTSTGGMTNKRWGRIGDSPVIGAGTYADNNTCGVSATGHGEYFIRSVVAYDVAAIMDYMKLPLVEAANEVIHTKLSDFGGTGGIICMDKQGNIAMPYNTGGMFRGYVNIRGEMFVGIWEE